MDRTDDDPDPAWLEALLKVYLDLGQKERALDLARSLVQGKGQDPRLWQVLAHLYMQAKLYDQAAAAMQVRASLTRPTREEIILLGDLYRMAGVPLKAARQYEKLLARKCSSQRRGQSGLRLSGRQAGRCGHRRA